MKKKQTDTAAAVDAAAPADPVRLRAAARAARKRHVVGMFAAVAAANGADLLTGDGGSMALLAGLVTLAGIVGIGFFIAACRAYARMRGHAGAVGVGGALLGLAVWIGITIVLNLPSLREAMITGALDAPMDTHAPFALWAGFAVGGLLLKALPERGGSDADGPADPATVPTADAPLSQKA